MLDVTERRHADDPRAARRRRRSTEDAVITKSLEGDILSWNAGARNMLGYAAEEVVGRSVNVIIPENRRDEELDILERVKQAKRVEPFETQRVARGGIIGASSIARDIGQRKRSSSRCVTAIGARTNAWRCSPPSCATRWRRSAAASPRCAWRYPTTPRCATSAASSMRQVRQMSRPLDDLLDVSRITHNELELRMEPLTLQAVIEPALETSRPLLESAGQAVQ